MKVNILITGIVEMLARSLFQRGNAKDFISLLEIGDREFNISISAMERISTDSLRDEITSNIKETFTLKQQELAKKYDLDFLILTFLNERKEGIVKLYKRDRKKDFLLKELSKILERDNTNTITIEIDEAYPGFNILKLLSVNEDRDYD